MGIVIDSPEGEAKDYTAADVNAALNSPELINGWAATLNGSHLPMDRQVSLKKWISEFRDQIVKQINDVEFVDSLSVILALRYIEIRAQWNGINTQIQFQMFRGQDPDPDLTVRGSLTSSLISEIERFIRSEDKDQADAFLDNPLIGDGVGLVRIDSNKVVIMGPHKVIVERRA
jgi:hypothetical protein